MNTTKVILIIGLIYVSLSYKDTSTRNMMLIMTGLIMICMLDLKEGLTCKEALESRSEQISDFCPLDSPFLISNKECESGAGGTCNNSDHCCIQDTPDGAEADSSTECINFRADKCGQFSDNECVIGIPHDYYDNAFPYKNIRTGVEARIPGIPNCFEGSASCTRRGNYLGKTDMYIKKCNFLNHVGYSEHDIIPNIYDKTIKVGEYNSFGTGPYNTTIDDYNNALYYIDEKGIISKYSDCDGGTSNDINSLITNSDQFGDAETVCNYSSEGLCEMRQPDDSRLLRNLRPETEHPHCNQGEDCCLPKLQLTRGNETVELSERMPGTCRSLGDAVDPDMGGDVDTYSYINWSGFSAGATLEDVQIDGETPLSPDDSQTSGSPGTMCDSNGKNGYENLCMYRANHEPINTRIAERPLGRFFYDTGAQAQHGSTCPDGDITSTSTMRSIMCDEHGGIITWRGCEPRICIDPVDTTGYVTIDGAEKNLKANMLNVVDMETCADGYDGQPVVTPCTVRDTPYTLSGCHETVCTEPTDKTGYNIYEGNLSRLNWDVSGTCENGYGPGPANIEQCSVNGEPYTISGCEPDYKTCLQLKTDNPTLACPEGVDKVSNHDTKIVHGVPSSGGGIQSDETNYHQFCCESIKYTCAKLHSDNESDRPPDDNKLDCTSGEFDIANSPLVSIVYDDVISHDNQRKQDLFDIACCREADLHFSDRNECVCGENGDTPNNIACIPVNPLNLLAGGEPTITPELMWVGKNGSLEEDWSQADILCDQGLINSYCARSIDNECNNEIPDTAVHASP